MGKWGEPIGCVGDLVVEGVEINIGKEGSEEGWLGCWGWGRVFVWGLDIGGLEDLGD